MDKFSIAKAKFEQGDARALADYVKNNELTLAQREFIASLIGGDVKRGDARKKPQTVEIEKLYRRAIVFKNIKTMLGKANQVKHMTTESIVGGIAEHLKMDNDTIKKSITRTKNKRKSSVIKLETKAGETVEKSGEITVIRKPKGDTV